MSKDELVPTTSSFVIPQMSLTFVLGPKNIIPLSHKYYGLAFKNGTKNIWMHDILYGPHIILCPNNIIVFSTLIYTKELYVFVRMV